jgi:hypothetical protein
MAQQVSAEQKVEAGVTADGGLVAGVFRVAQRGENRPRV